MIQSSLDDVTLYAAHRLVGTDSPHVRAAWEFKGRDDLWSYAPLEYTERSILPLTRAGHQLQLGVTPSAGKLLLHEKAVTVKCQKLSVLLWVLWTVFTRWRNCCKFDKLAIFCKKSPNIKLSYLYVETLKITNFKICQCKWFTFS